MLYKRGQEVLRCRPFAQALKNRYLSDYCDFCLQFKLECRLLQCGGCKIIHYCGPKCQKKSWRAYHREECAYLQKLHFIPQDDVRIMFRIILKLGKGGHREFDVLPDGRERYFSDLMSHRDEIIEDTARMEEYRSLSSLLWHCFKLSGSSSAIMAAYSFPKNPEAGIDIYGRYVINSLSIYNIMQDDIGHGLYLGASILDHSCHPTAIWNFCKGTDLFVRTIEDVDDLDGLRVSGT